MGLLSAGRLLVVLLAVLLAIVLRPWVAPPAATPGFEVLTSDPTLDSVLERHSKVIGSDAQAYRNHCLRVLSYTRFFLTRDYGFGEKELADAAATLSYGLAYHDIGLWTDNTLDYLQPSADRARKELAGVKGIDVDTVAAIITEHHKVTPWEGKNAALVNAMRRGDWVDASLGVVRQGMPSGNIASANAALPNAGFHACLQAFPGKLHPDEWGRRAEILRIFKW